MSGESSLNASSASRSLRLEEQTLVKGLLLHVTGGSELAGGLARSQIVDLADGGMGSIRFLGPGPQTFGKELVTAEYIDEDGTLVLISLNSDTLGRLFEVDYWKVDFSAILRYPTPAELTVISHAA